MNVFVHIGYSKTATTWMQQVLFPRHPEINYLHLEPGKNQWIARIVLDNSLDFDAGVFKAACAEEAAKTPDKLVGISWESFAGCEFLGGFDTATNAKRLKSIFPEAKILVFIRNQLDMLESIYKQYVFEGGTLSLKDLLELRRTASLISLSRDHYRYERMLDLYLELFGADQVHISLFEEFKAHPLKVCDRIALFLGIDPFPVSTDHFKQRANSGLSYQSLFLMRFMNRFVYSKFNLAPLIPKRCTTFEAVGRFTHERLDRHLQKFPYGSGGLLNENLKSNLSEYYAAGNQVLTDRFSLPLKDYGYPM